MSRIKRLVLILALIIIFMLLIPLLTVNFIESDAGMMAVIILFFIINPFLSLVLGIISGKEIRFFWFTPFLVAVLFWAFSSLTYNTAFPIVYSLIYFAISFISMILTRFFPKKRAK